MRILTDCRCVRLAQAISPEDAQLYYQTFPGRPPRPELGSSSRAGFEMTLLRMLASGWCEALGERAGGRRCRNDAKRRPARLSRLGAAAPTIAIPASIDADNWASVVEAANLSGMVRQLALNCIPEPSSATS